MNEILKPGETGWFRRRDGLIAFAVRVPGRRNAQSYTDTGRLAMHSDGKFHTTEDSPCDLIEALPECTGFDWKPPKKYVPWDIHTMPLSVLVKDILAKDMTGVDIYVARPVTNANVDVGYGVRSYQSLFEKFVQLDGTPCGRMLDE